MNLRPGAEGPRRQGDDHARESRGGRFRKSIRDLKGQQDLPKQNKDIRTLDAMQQMILEAEQAHAQDPADPGRLAKLIELLRKTETTEYENRAIELLDQKYNETRVPLPAADRADPRSPRWPATSGVDRRGPQEPHRRRGPQGAPAVPPRAPRARVGFSARWRKLPDRRLAKLRWPERLFVLGRSTRRSRSSSKSAPTRSTRPRPACCSAGVLEAGFPDEAVDTLQGVISEYRQGDERSIEMHYWYARAWRRSTNCRRRSRITARWRSGTSPTVTSQQRTKRLREPGASRPRRQHLGSASAPGAATSLRATPRGARIRKEPRP